MGRGFEDSFLLTATFLTSGYFSKGFESFEFLKASSYEFETEEEDWFCSCSKNKGSCVWSELFFQFFFLISSSFSLRMSRSSAERVSSLTFEEFWLEEKLEEEEEEKEEWEDLEESLTEDWDSKVGKYCSSLF